MSRIFVALTELARAAERAERKEVQYLAAPCHSCGSTVPADRLFCPKCDSFQGSVASLQCEEGDSSAGHESSSNAPVSGFRRWSPEKWAHAPSLIAIALVAALILLVILAFILYRGRSVKREGTAAPTTREMSSSVEVAPQVTVNPDLNPISATETKGRSSQREFAIASVSRIEVVPADDGLSVQIIASRTIRARIKQLNNPPSVVIDVLNALLKTDQACIPSDRRV
jgi:hypothetical protein